MAANSILGEESTPTISDYYHQKFKKKAGVLEEISEEDEKEVKKNNFIAEKSIKKIDKSSQQKRMQSADKQKIVKGPDGWKKDPSSQK